MISLKILCILTFFNSTAGFLCECSGFGLNCPDGCEAGSYCFSTWILRNGGLKEQGCKTTRADLLADRQCQTNRKGLVTCVCNTEKCNGQSFTIPSDISLTVPPTIKCFNGDLIENNFCFGHYCTYSGEVILNDFGDILPSSYPIYRGCADDEYNDDLNSVNVCTLSNSIITCKCNTPFCNRDPAFPIPLGNVLCFMSSSYTDSSTKALKYCRGHLCYKLPTDEDGKTSRGCLSVSDGAPEELKKSGTYRFFKYCNQDLCNGDFAENAMDLIKEDVENITKT
ncbi:hypothetical protein B9Z55_018033 [Caenorhabditis nigoni]|uniref:Activin types I and II receptor domain-containing protein n=1 Tax=Caenorhabditis nigoni TaxID=1611254 RepID=A0A2G5TC00_9PELO|nr:hypothetical protein B9Z55_018033 [Caenorhabditis nigoni]